MELGYQATECRGTIALEAENPGGLPPIHHHFFEFVERGRWDDGRPEFLTLGELERGRQYYILVTTTAGLYRYFMNDLVEVTGQHANTPLFRFVQKGRGVTSLTGEKLYEAQVIEAVQHAASRFGFAAGFFLAIAEEERAAYSVFIERDDAAAGSADVAAEIDRRLSELNLEYRSKRSSGRLSPLSVSWLSPAAAEAYKSACVQSGQREGQFKPAVLQYRAQVKLDLDQYVVT
jgi:hypothetical protein